MKRTADEIWLSHLTPNEEKWIALVGDYPHKLVGVGEDLAKALTEAKAKGYDDPILFYVPPFMPLCVTPFPA